jgi:hypothetical protein
MCQRLSLNGRQLDIFAIFEWDCMGDRIKEEWNNLTPAKRARRCRLMAQEARSLATRASPDLRLHYIQIAEEWLQLAIEIEFVALERRPQ